MTSRVDPYVAYRVQLLQEGQTLQSLCEQLRQGEPEARDRLAKFLHRLHGTAGTYGFDRVSSIAEALRDAVLARPVRPLDEAVVGELAAALFEASLGPGVAGSVSP